MMYTLILLLSMLSPKAQACCCDCPPNPLCPEAPGCGVQR